MDLYHTHDGLLYFFLDVARATLISGTVPTLNLPIKGHPSSGWLRFS